MTGQDHMERLLSAARELTEFLMAENDALSKREFKVEEDSLKRKDQLVRTYEAYVNELEDYAEEIKEVDPSIKQKVMDVGNSLMDLVSDNALRLRARYEANMQVISAFSDAVISKSNKLNTYSSTGRQGAGGGTAQSKIMPTALDQSF